MRLEEGRKPLPIGTKRIRNGYLWVKRSTGWEYVGKEDGGDVTPQATPKFLSGSEYLSTADKHADKWTLEEKKSLTAYSGDLYFSINPVLRGEEDADDYNERSSNSLLETIEHIDSAIQKCSFDKDIKVHRFAGKKVLAKVSSMKEGDIFTDNAFLSTTAHDDVEHEVIKGSFSRNVIFVINVPKGTPAIALQGHHETRLEHEVLLGRGTKLRLDKIELRSEVDQLHSATVHSATVTVTVVP